MVPPIGTLLDGVNTRTGLMEAPATPPEVMEVNTIPVMAAASNATDNPASALVLIRKPPVTIARAPPRVSPFRVIVTAAVPVAAPAVERMIEALVAVAAVVEAAANDGTLLAMDIDNMTDPKK